MTQSFPFLSASLSRASNNRRNPLKENFDSPLQPISCLSLLARNTAECETLSRSGNAASTGERDDDEESSGEKTFRPKIARRNDPIKYFFSFVADAFSPSLSLVEMIFYSGA